MLCQLLPVNRRATFEFSVLCPEICVHLASYLDSPSLPSMPNYIFPNLKRFCAKSHSSNVLNNPSEKLYKLEISPITHLHKHV